MQSSNTSLQYRYPIELLRVKKKKKIRMCTLHFSVAICLTTLLFSLTTVHGVVTGQLAHLSFDPWKVWLLFDNICIECTKVKQNRQADECAARRQGSSYASMHLITMLYL